jgi:hypothetical protein
MRLALTADRSQSVTAAFTAALHAVCTTQWVSTYISIYKTKTEVTSKLRNIIGENF